MPIPRGQCADYRAPTADHGGGWPEDNAWGDRQLWRSNAELSAILAPGVTFASAPGRVYEYSNLGYMVLGRVIANVSGESSLDFITHRILQPLGMHDTVWNAEDVAPQRLARGYHWLDGRWIEEPLLPSGGDAAVFGGLYSTVSDLARWVAFQLCAWPPRDEPDYGIVRRATLREMQQPQRLYTPETEAPEIGRRPCQRRSGHGRLWLRLDRSPMMAISPSSGMRAVCRALARTCVGRRIMIWAWWRWAMSAMPRCGWRRPRRCCS